MVFINCFKYTFQRSSICLMNKHGPRASNYVFCSHFRKFSKENFEQQLHDVDDSPLHIPVLAKEAVNILNPSTGKVFIDMTFGAGGHTKELLSANDDITVYALDRDPTAIKLASDLAKLYSNRIVPLKGKFSDLDKLLEAQNVPPESVDGVLFDVGCSSMQLDTSERGFSVLRDAPLDMRMCQDSDEPTAADVINTLDFESIAKILKTYGEVKNSKKIARAIVEAKYMQPIKTTKQLVMLVRSAYTRDMITADGLEQAAHVATKTFQALRIFVNNELNEFNIGLHLAHKYLKKDKPLVAICFQSLEDRIVKNNFIGPSFQNSSHDNYIDNYKNIGKTFSSNEISDFMQKKWKLLTKKSIKPSLEEIKRNSRSRTARLRAATKV